MQKHREGASSRASGMPHSVGSRMGGDSKQTGTGFQAGSSDVMKSTSKTQPEEKLNI